MIKQFFSWHYKKVFLIIGLPLFWGFFNYYFPNQSKFMSSEYGVNLENRNIESCEKYTFDYEIKNAQNSLNCLDVLGDCNLTISIINKSDFDWTTNNNSTNSIKIKKQYTLENGNIKTDHQPLEKTHYSGTQQEYNISLSDYLIKGDIQIDIEYTTSNHNIKDVACKPQVHGKPVQINVNKVNEFNILCIDATFKYPDDEISCKNFESLAPKSVKLGKMYSKDAQRRWGNETTNLFCDIKYKDQSYSNIIEEMQKKIKLAYTHISNIEITYDINNFEDKINYLSNCKSEKENNCTASSSSFTLLQETTETPLNKSVISNYNNDNYKIDCIFVIPHNKS